MGLLFPLNFIRVLNRWRASRSGRRSGPSSSSGDFEVIGAPDSGSWPRIRAALESILIDNIIPFWNQTRLNDPEGGYYLHHDRLGRWKGPCPKRLVTQARTVWFFSRLYTSPYRRPEHLDMARHGYRFLRDRIWDRQEGGFYWEVNAPGTEATRSGKQLYGQAFGLYALSRYAVASEDPSAFELARELFDLLERHAYDRPFGGYQEFFHRNWEPVNPDARTYLNHPANLKLMNTHLHLMEALTEFFRLTQDGKARERIGELIDLMSRRIVDERLGASTDQFQRDWTRCSTGEGNRTSYGHNLECLWLLAEARSETGRSRPEDIDTYLALFRYSIRFGFDDEGGICESGPLSLPADRRDRIWWVQAEALVSALYLYQLTGEEEFRIYFERILNWIGSRQTDWKRGEWYARVTSGGWVRGNKADAWKSPYHNGRAMLVCLEILSRLANPREVFP